MDDKTRYIDPNVQVDSLAVTDDIVICDEVQTDIIVEKTADAGVTIDGVLLKDDDVCAAEVQTDSIVSKSEGSPITFCSALAIDQIDEKTPDAGVTVEGVLLKDSDVCADEVQTDSLIAKTESDSIAVCSPLAVDQINQKTEATGVTVEGVLLMENDVCADEVQTDSLIAKTEAGAITVSSPLAVDQINENTLDAGVTIEGVLLKDSDVCADEVQTDSLIAKTESDSIAVCSPLAVDQINQKTEATGVTVEGVLLMENDVCADEVQTDSLIAKTEAGAITVSSPLAVDQINENTLDAGVTIEGVLLKDSDVCADEVQTDSLIAKTESDSITISSPLDVDQINENTLDAGVTIDGVLLKDSDVCADEVQTDSIISKSEGGAGVISITSTIAIDFISENTLNAGVTIDGVLLKDSDVCADEVQTDSLISKTESDSITVNSPLAVDQIDEKTAAAGVTIEGVLLKDSLVEFTPSGGVGVVWDTTAPTSLQEAINRIAAALATEIGVPIP